MGVTKKDKFTEGQNEVAELAKAIAHPARVAILEHLIEADACITGDLVDVLPLSQATVSQHLKELKRVGLISGEVEGPKMCYCVNQKKLIAAQKIFHDWFKSTNKCC